MNQFHILTERPSVFADSLDTLANDCDRLTEFSYVLTNNCCIFVQTMHDFFDILYGRKYKLVLQEIEDVYQSTCKLKMYQIESRKCRPATTNQKLLDRTVDVSNKTL